MNGYYDGGWRLVPNHVRDIVQDAMQELETMRLSDYTTEELARLTTLTCATMICGEYAIDEEGDRVFRTDLDMEEVGAIVDSDGIAWATDGEDETPPRRIRSFDGPTELDPPQADMLAELERRRRPAMGNKTHAGKAVTFFGQRGRIMDNSMATILQTHYGFGKDQVWIMSDAGTCYNVYPQDVTLLD